MEISGDVTDAGRTTNDEQGKIELLSQMDAGWLSFAILVMVEVQPQVLEGLKKKKGMKDLTQVLVIFLINNFLHSHLLSLFNLCCVRRPPSKREELRGSHLDVGLQLYSTA